MCRYCDKEQDNVEILKNDGIKIEIFKFSGDNEYELLVNNRMIIPVSFCPFCGRKLNGSGLKR